MLIMKAWLETRWRLLATFTYLLICLGIYYRHQNPVPATVHGLLIALGTVLVLGALTLAGSGVKSQSAVSFPEGLAGSTQFTISLPVSRLRLLSVRAAFGMLELVASAALIGCLAWGLFPSVRGAVTPADLARFLVTTVLCLTAPYCSALLFGAFLDEPLSYIPAGWTIVLLLWIGHRIAPAVDIIRVYGQASPLITHSLPWSQLATSVAIAAILFLAAVRVVRAREY